MRVIMRMLPALMTSADLDHNDELLAALRKKEKLEWVTPRLTLMEAEDTDATKEYPFEREGIRRKRGEWTFLTPSWHKPRPLQQKPITPTGLQRPFLMAWSIDYLAPSVLI